MPLEMKRHTRDTIVAEINKRLKSGKANNAEVMLMWQRLILGDPEFWKPLFELWCGKRGATMPVEPEPISAYDREGK